MWEPPRRDDHRDAKVPPTLLFLRPEQREEDNVTDRFCAGEQHGEPINADAKAAGWRHAILEREQKFFVDFLRLFARLFEQTLTLQERIVQLAVARGDLRAVDDELKNIDE